MDSIRPYINWQTTIEYLKDPPAEYAEKIQEPYDFFSEFERIYSQAKSGSYANEYAFGHELYLAFQRTHDGHFVSRALYFLLSRLLTLVLLSAGDLPRQCTGNLLFRANNAHSLGLARWDEHSRGLPLLRHHGSHCRKCYVRAKPNYHD